eukprot:XP_016869623.1 uncharacterized protein LOC101927506 isoform X2 [Homo sapiens]
MSLAASRRRAASILRAREPCRAPSPAGGAGHHCKEEGPEVALVASRGRNGTAPWASRSCSARVQAGGTRTGLFRLLRFHPSVRCAAGDVCLCACTSPFPRSPPGGVQLYTCNTPRHPEPSDVRLCACACAAPHSRPPSDPSPPGTRRRASMPCAASPEQLLRRRAAPLCASAGAPCLCESGVGFSSAQTRRASRGRSCVLICTDFSGTAKAEQSSPQLQDKFEHLKMIQQEEIRKLEEEKKQLEGEIIDFYKMKAASEALQTQLSTDTKKDKHLTIWTRQQMLLSKFSKEESEVK